MSHDPLRFSKGLGLTSISYQRYNPDLQKRSLQNRQGTQQDFDDFVGKLKEYSRSDKPSVFPSEDLAMGLFPLTKVSQYGKLPQRRRPR